MITPRITLDSNEKVLLIVKPQPKAALYFVLSFWLFPFMLIGIVFGSILLGTVGIVKNHLFNPVANPAIELQSKHALTNLLMLQYWWIPIVLVMFFIFYTAVNWYLKKYTCTITNKRCILMPSFQSFKSREDFYFSSIADVRESTISNNFLNRLFEFSAVEITFSPSTKPLKSASSKRDNLTIQAISPQQVKEILALFN